MSQNYGVLRIVRILSERQPANTRRNPPAKSRQGHYSTGWLPEEGLVHLLTQRETTIGRALTNDIILMDPTVSREHARLVLDSSGWSITNLTTSNVVRVNGRVVPADDSMPMQPQDIVILGSTMLQLVAPDTSQSAVSEMSAEFDPALYSTSQLTESTQKLPPARPPGISIEWGRQPQNLPSQSDASVKGSISSPVSSFQGREDNVQEHVPASFKDGKHDGHAITPPSNPVVAAKADSSSLGPNVEFEDVGEESLLGPGVTLHFALPQGMGKHLYWLIAGVGLTLLLISTAITIILNNVIGLSTFTQSDAANILAVITIPILPALGISLLVNFIDRFEREPWFLRLAAFLWGAIIAIPPALFIEQNLGTVLQNLLGPNANDLVRTALQGLNAGVTEETVKGLGLLLLFIVLRDEFDNVVDGIVYGALIGAGFAMVENFVYFAHNASSSLVFLIVGRIILGWLGHSTFTACFGAALGYVRHTRVRWKQIVIPLLGYFLAVGLHSFFDFVDFQASAAVQNSHGNSTVAWYSLIAIICNYIPPFLVQIGLLYILIEGLRHEAAIIREFLAVEVTNGIVMVDEYALLQNSFRRTKEERRVLRKSGFRQWLRVKALYQTEIGLAFRKWHVHMGDKPKLGYVQPEDAYRKRIKRLRNEINHSVQRQGY